MSYLVFTWYVGDVNYGLHTIEAISSVRQDEYDDVDVESAQVGTLPPRHTFEGATGEEEVTFGRFDGNNILRCLGWTAQIGDRHGWK
jgi:hypothetical protein